MKELSKVITCDKTRVHYFDPKSKRESEVWRTSFFLKAKKVHRQKSAGKVMLCVFFDAQGVISQHVVSPKMKINAVYCVQVINKKWQEIAHSWILHHDNARLHVASIVRDFLEKHEILMVAHPPYSADLAPRFLVTSICKEDTTGPPVQFKLRSGDSEPDILQFSFAGWFWENHHDEMDRKNEYAY